MKIKLYNLTEKGKSLTFKDWLKMGGCNLAAGEEWYVVRVLGLPPARWDDLTLGQIADAYIVANRQLARWAANNFEKNGFHTEEFRQQG